MTPGPTLRELNRRAFAGTGGAEVFFQPRIEPWFDLHQRTGDLSERLRSMSLLEFYDDLGVSMRYTHYYTGQPYPVVTRHRDGVRVGERETGPDRRTRVLETPAGRLVEGLQRNTDGKWYTVDHAVRTAAELEILCAYYAGTTYHLDLAAFRAGAAYLGERGEPSFWLPKSPYQALCQWWMTLEDFIVALAETPEAVHAAMDAIDAAYDPLYAELAAAAGELFVVNFGENIHAQLTSPRYFERYFLPFYAKRSGQLRRAGIRTHVHIDGFFKPLLGYLKDLPFDGLEALTPLPQGDVTLEEMRGAIGDKILLDGIPAILFMPYYPPAQLDACVERVIELFAPRLVLGISDEFPQGAPESCLERVRAIARRCRTGRA